MRAPRAVLLPASAIAPALSTPTANAVPAAASSPADASTAAPACIVPEIFFNSLPSPFTLSVLAPNPSDAFPVRLSPAAPTVDTPAVPVLGAAGAAPAQFRLENGTLLADGFAAHNQPGIEVFPPPLRGFEFGGVWGGCAEPFRGRVCVWHAREGLDAAATG